MSEQIIALADCNSFYCSCERVFDPSLNNRPVGVLSNNDGCFVSRTNELKALGVAMGAPFFKVKDIVKRHNVAVFSSNYVLYGDMSARVMTTLKEFSPDLQVYSIDEAFLDLSQFRSRNLERYAREIKKTVRRDTGIPLSIGIAHTKVLAKLANQWVKMNENSGGVLDLTNPKLHEPILKQMPVGKIWGIGQQSVAKLLPLGIKTAWHLHNADERVIQKLLTVQGRRIVHELRGESCISLGHIDAERKEILSSRSFGKPVFSKDDLREAIANHVSTAADKLRKQDGLCHRLIVFVQTNPHKDVPQYANNGYMKILSGTSVTPKLIQRAFDILERIYRPDYEYKKCGVVLTDLTRKTEQQTDFFNLHDTERTTSAMAVVDLINQRFGRGTIKSAACGLYNDWKMLSEMRSPCYTTRWPEILEVG